MSNLSYHTPYLLDDEGYVVVEFDETTNDNEPSVLDAVSKKYVRMAYSGKLTKEVLSKIDYTELVRLATHPVAKDIIWNTLSIRSVPIRWGINKKGEKLKEPYRIRPYQQQVINWMREQEMHAPDKNGIRGGIVSLKMGLGKSLISLVHSLSSEKGEYPTLIVASKTMVYEWKTECVEKFFGNRIKVLYLHKDIIGKMEMDNVDREHIKKYDFVITSYDTCKTACRYGQYNEQCYEMGDEHTLMKGKIVQIHLRTKAQADLPHIRGIEIIYGTPWRRVICDESQTFANPNTKTYHSIMAIYGDYKWCLTGTPIRNYDTDIWSQLRYCGYNGCTAARLWKRGGIRLFKEHDLKAVILTMGYEDAGIALPPRVKAERPIVLQGNEKELYQIVLGKTRKAYSDMLKGLCNYACVLAMFTRLRQCAIAPYLMTAESKREKPSGLEKKTDDIAKKLLDVNAKDDLGLWCHDKNGTAGIYSTKITEIVNTIKNIPTKQKMLIFSTFTSCLDLLVEALKVKMPNLGYLQVDGDTVGEERSRLITLFKTDDSTRVLLLTYKVGSEGLNLTEACHCIFIEPWWTPAVHNQAEARVWRQGQVNTVTTHFVLAKNTIEERVMEICKEKDELSSSFLNGTNKKGKVGLDIYTLGRIIN